MTITMLNLKVFFFLCTVIGLETLALYFFDDVYTQTSTMLGVFSRFKSGYHTSTFVNGDNVETTTALRVASNIMVFPHQKSSVVVSLTPMSGLLQGSSQVDPLSEPMGAEPHSATISTDRRVLTTADAAGPLQMCPDMSPHLVGHRAINTLPRMINELEHQFSFMKTGSGYRPPDCRPDQRTAILIPYRNRWKHLLILLYNLVPYLVRQQVSFTIFVIEMQEPTTFNRGLLLNVGVLEALKFDNYTCFIFHDVDLIPLNDHNLYRCGKNPIHLAVAMNKFKYKLVYKGYVGGVTGMSKDQILRVNGFSNLYFGWGGEDDDLYARIVTRKMQVFRHPAEVSRYNMIKHDIDKGNEVNANRLTLLKTSPLRLSVDGLNTVKYHVTGIERKTLYTWIKVSVNKREVMTDGHVIQYTRKLKF